MRLAYISNWDAKDKRTNSGLHYHMSNQLSIFFTKIDYYHPKSRLVALIDRIFRKIFTLQFGRGTLYENSIYNSIIYGFYFSFKIAFKNYDYIFISRGSNIAAFLYTSIPIIYTSDATFKLMYAYYEHFSFIPKNKFSFFNRVEERALQNSSVIIYPSQWAAKSAIEHYKTPLNKVHIIPSGANFDRDEIPPRITTTQRQLTSRCKLLFIGLDWQRKGGEFAYKTALAMNSKGIDTVLTVIGCKPPITPAEHIEIIGFLDKRDKNDAKKLQQCFLESNFFILPTKAETFGLVLVEACAFGLPVLAPDTGGISTIIDDNINGYLLPTSATPKDYSEKIIKVFLDQERYSTMSKASRAKFEDTLNWDVWGNHVADVLKQHQKNLP